MSLALTYPGGKLLSVTIAATAGNVTTNKTPGSGKRWKLLSGTITLVADGNAANRRIQLFVTDGTDVIGYLGQSDADITATQTSTIDIQPFSTPVNWDLGRVGVTLRSALVISGDQFLEGADQFRVSIAAGLAGDSYSGTLRVMELGITP